MFLTAIPREKVVFRLSDVKIFFRLLFRGELIKADAVSKFESSFAHYTGTEFAVAVSSGRQGLRLILEAMGLKDGDEVILPVYTFYAVPEAVKKMGLVPKFVDIDLSDYNMDTGLIEKEITQHTKAIIATHLFGNPCKTDEIIEIARRHNLFVIEDCAQAIGAEYRGKKVGSLGDCAYFSFETGKPFHTFGGGIVTTNNRQLHDKIRNKIEEYVYPDFLGLVKKMSFTFIESLFTKAVFFTLFIYPFLLFATYLNKDLIRFAKNIKRKTKLLETRYINFQAAIGLSKLDNLNTDLQKRAINAAFLMASLNSSILAAQINPENKPIFYYLVLRCENNDLFSKKLLAQGIDVFEATNNCSAGTDLELKYPLAKKADEQIIQVPMYPQLRRSSIARIAKSLNSIFEQV